MRNNTTIEQLLENSRYGVFTYPEMYIDIIDKFRNTCFFESCSDTEIDEHSVFVPYSMLTQIIEAYDEDMTDMESFIRLDVHQKQMWILAEDLISLYRDIHNPHPSMRPAMFKNAVPLHSVYNKKSDNGRVNNTPKKESLDSLLKKCKEDSCKPYDRSYNLKTFMDLPAFNTIETLANGNYARSEMFATLKQAFVDFYNERNLEEYSKYYRIKDILCDLLFDDYHKEDPDEMNFRYYLICTLLYDVVMFDQGTSDTYDYDFDIEELAIENEANDSIIPMKGDFI